LILFFFFLDKFNTDIVPISSTLNLNYNLTSK